MLGHKDIRIENTEGICCTRCNLPLEPAKITLSYMRSTFPTTLLRCPQCGQCYLPEELALGPAQEVEASLEEK